MRGIDNPPSRRRSLRLLVAFCCVATAVTVFSLISARSKLPAGEQRLRVHGQSRFPFRVDLDRPFANGTRLNSTSSAPAAALNSSSSLADGLQVPAEPVLDKLPFVATGEPRKEELNNTQPGEIVETQGSRTLREQLFASEMTVGGRKPEWLKPGPCETEDSLCWDHCLPFKGETNVSCAHATRFDLAEENVGKLCHVSVLHLLLEDFLDVVKAGGNATAHFRPLLTLGTLLGSYRNQTLIRWTHDIDLAYFVDEWTPDVRNNLKHGLRAKGYILFKQTIWRVCLSTQHPKAADIYDGEISAKARQNYAGDIPYLDMYGLSEEGDIFKHETVSGTLRSHDVFPLKNFSLLGKQYHAIQRPEALFRLAGYGDFMKERKENHK